MATTIKKGVRRPLDRAMPRKIDAFVPEAKLYTDLCEFEKKLDATIVRKRQDIQEALTKPLKAKRTLRIFLSNFGSNQMSNTQAMAMDTDSEFSKIPSWTLQIQGRLLDPPNSRKLSNQPKFSNFLRTVIIHFERDENLYPEGNVVEWHKTDNSTEFDGFEVKRKGDMDTKANILMYLDHNPEKFALSSELADILDVHTETKNNIIMALWQYIKLHKLQDPDDKKMVVCDMALTKLFRSQKVAFTNIPQLIAPHLGPAAPIKIEYTIRVSQEYVLSSLAYDIEVDVDDPVRVSMSNVLTGGDLTIQKEIALLDEQIGKQVEDINNCKLKREFMLAFAKDPVNFINQWVASQSRDLEVILGDIRVNLEETRRSSFYQESFVSDALFHYLQKAGGIEGAQKLTQNSFLHASTTDTIANKRATKLTSVACQAFIMGNCGSTEEDRKASQVSKSIDKSIKEDERNKEFAIKLLLLGSGESGKSTVLKQFKLIHGVGFSDSERMAFRPAIVSNVMNCAKALVAAMDSLEIPYGWPYAHAPRGSPVRTDAVAEKQGSSKDVALSSSQDGLDSTAEEEGPMSAAEFRCMHGGDADVQASVRAAALISQSPGSYGEGEPIPEDILKAIETMWSDKGVQYCVTRSSEYQLMDSCEYYMADLGRFLNAGYTPTNQDILSARVMTTTITETKFKVEHALFRIFDVGGQRSERKKWAPYFDDCSAIIFISAISAYDQTCFEDNATNRMIESLNLFGSICNHPLFKSTSMIVFLNKIDLFRKKLLQVPVKKFFPQYNGPNAFEPASEYFASRFMALNKSSEKKIYIHFTWATDTKQIRTVLITVNAIILRLNLEASGI
ncbi:SWI SNF, matrix associated, actin dependent regulator of chromatin, sub d, member 1 [Irineochytrium annulatum]|nr:SWI SNF, matrix associated, actin dependent regulator of chromatin, sub d, member 1 [Irineochytrium annulatum]